MEQLENVDRGRVQTLVSSPVTAIDLHVCFFAFHRTLSFGEWIFSIGVVFREIIFFALLLSMLKGNPQFLFFDPMANWEDGNTVLACAFALGPDFMVSDHEIGMLISAPLSKKLTSILIMLNSCSLGALVAGAAAGNLQAIMAVLYILSCLSAALAVLAASFGENELAQRLRYSLGILPDLLIDVFLVIPIGIFMLLFPAFFCLLDVMLVGNLLLGRPMPHDTDLAVFVLGNLVSIGIMTCFFFG
jgi:hypothetical protein